MKVFQNDIVFNTFTHFLKIHCLCFLSLSVAPLVTGHRSVWPTIQWRVENRRPGQKISRIRKDKEKYLFWKNEKQKNKKLCTIQGDGQEQLWSLLIHWRFREEMLFVPVYCWWSSRLTLPCNQSSHDSSYY